MEQTRETAAQSAHEIDVSALEGVTGELKTENPHLRRMLAEAESVQAFLEQKADLDNPGALAVRLNELDSYMARMSAVLVRARSMREEAKNRFLMANGEAVSGMTATASARLMGRYLQDYTMTADRIETLCGALSQSCRILITQISLVKKQMELQGGIPRCI